LRAPHPQPLPPRGGWGSTLRFNSNRARVGSMGRAGLSIKGGAALALALLLLAGAVNYVDRITLSLAAPLISAQLHLKAGAMGVLLSAFLWTYALAQWPAGVLIDRLGPRRLLGGALVLWSAAQGATGLAAGLPQLVIARMCLGL